MKVSDSVHVTAVKNMKVSDSVHMTAVKNPWTVSFRWVDLHSRKSNIQTVVRIMPGLQHAQVCLMSTSSMCIGLQCLVLTNQNIHWRLLKSLTFSFSTCWCCTYYFWVQIPNECFKVFIRFIVCHKSHQSHSVTKTRSRLFLNANCEHTTRIL